MLNAGASFTSKTLFAFVKNIGEPNAGDLRSPVSFFRSERKPTKDADGSWNIGFDQDVTPYHNAWAQVWQSQRAMLNNQNTENFVSHVFLVRNFPGFTPEVRDYVLWEGSICSVRGTRNIEADTQNAWLIVLAEQEGFFKEEPRNVENADGTPNTDVPEDPSNPLWM